MKTLMLATLLLLTACAHHFDHQDFKRKVDQIESNSLKDVRSDTDRLLAQHTELDRELKMKIRNLIDQHLTIHQELKNEEARTIHHMLEETISDPSPGTKYHGKVSLKDLYERKAQNVTKLVQDIRQLTQGQASRGAFLLEFEQLMREIR